MSNTTDRAADRPADRARAAFTRACLLDVQVRKPGNVSLVSPGHGMDAALFMASAKAAAGPLCAPGARVGPRIEAAMQATWAVAGCNTNLGILLLCAPVAMALERHPQATTPAALQAAIGDVLGDLDTADAEAAYRAIAQANPGGLGNAERQDVREVPSVNLRAAMALAADRDSIALQYRDGYAQVFETGLTALGPAFALTAESGHYQPPHSATVAAVQRTFLALLSTLPDSHIARKHGVPTAHAVMHQAQPWHALAVQGAHLDAEPEFKAWDAALKAQGINPGTTADLTVVSLMLAALCGPASAPKRDGP